MRRFVYNGNTIRQALTGHSAAERWFTHAGCDPLGWPIDGENVSSVEYTNLVRVRRVTDGDRAFVEWLIEFKSTHSSDLKDWTSYFANSIPVWLASLGTHLDTRAVDARESVASKG